MRVLLLAHDFPPVRSPQSIRAAAFASELALAGAHITVVTRECGVVEADRLGVDVRRVSPGPLESLVNRAARRRAGAGGGAVASEGAERPAPAVGLNWKGRLVRRLRRGMHWICFPDATVVWARNARPLVESLLASGAVDRAIVMHEPGGALLLASSFVRAGVPWIADLADPVLAQYTLAHWRNSAFRLERDVSAGATHVTVTNRATKDLIAHRHGLPEHRITVITQGFDNRDAPKPVALAPERMNLVYTGRLYAFRSVVPLLSAMREVDGVVLHVAGPEPPAELVRAAELFPDRVMLHGEVSHAYARGLQAGADVLLSIGNAGLPQTPGKIYEYLGAGRPVMHIAETADETAGLLAATGRGVSVAPAGISLELQRLVADWSEGSLDSRFDMNANAACGYTWRAQVASLARILSEFDLQDVHAQE
ncbi:glycosyltransferase family protein [Pseudoxanthomonas daejeonensis]|uniref:glycosyltransferase n=1 Tax=Pseudoxanthomonas daejeonensis TaxID=266062 RepID=UPI001390A8FA|nr:glycosyltransferase [Pseudoxanthomonas daejeonensis]